MFCINIATRSLQTTTTELPAIYAELNRKKMDKLMEDLTGQYQAEVIKIAEEKTAESV